MSRYIKELCDTFRTDPDSWTPTFGNAVYSGAVRGDVEIRNAGLGVWTSIVDVYVNGHELRLFRGDRRRIERALSRWTHSRTLRTIATGRKYADMRHVMARPRMDGGVMFDPVERAALDAVPETKKLVCGWCEKVTTFRRGILGDAVVYACENSCGSISAARPVNMDSPKG